MKENIKIFVYGTLLEGYGNHRNFLKGRSKKLGEFTTPAEYEMIHLGGFPGVVPDGKTAIIGEVYEIGSDVARNIDGLEGYRKDNPTEGLYNKVLIPTNFGDAYMYTYNIRGGRTINEFNNSDYIVASGSWKTVSM